MNKNKKIILAFFFIYLYIMSTVVFRVPIMQWLSSSRIWLQQLNLIPFREMNVFINNPYRNGFFDPNIWANIAMFIPIGFVLTFFQQNQKPAKIILQTLVLSLTIETIQFIFGLGITDIDDLILNTMGGSLGVGIFILFRLILKNEKTLELIITILTSIIGTFMETCQSRKSKG